jgi:hypothetical protein
LKKVKKKKTQKMFFPKEKKGREKQTKFSFFLDFFFKSFFLNKRNQEKMEKVFF